MPKKHPPELFEQARALIEQGVPVTKVSEKTGISLSALYARIGAAAIQAGRKNFYANRNKDIKKKTRDMAGADGRHLRDIAAELGMSYACLHKISGGVKGLFGNAAERNTRAEKDGRYGAPRGYISFWTPNEKTRVMIREHVAAVLIEYHDHLPLTVRQVFYRLVGAYDYPKTENFYKSLQRAIALARRAQWIDFDDIRDDGTQVRAPSCFSGVNAFHKHIASLVGGYRKDLMRDQDTYIEIWCEASGMLPQLSRVANPFCIPCLSGSGYNSLTEIKDVADRIRASGKDRAIILHLGDFDPSGENIFDSLSDDVTAFVNADSDGEIEVEFRRVALTREQVEQHNLPTAPPKREDSRTKNWKHKETCQLEAMPPNQIANLLRAAIEEIVDKDLMEKAKRQERKERNEIHFGRRRWWSPVSLR